MRAQDDLAAMTKNKFDGWQRLADAGVVEDFCAVVGERHIEIDPNQHMLVLQLVRALGQAADGWDVHDLQLSFLRHRELRRLQFRCAMRD